MHRVQPFTIGLISLAAFAGCDPVWRVNNPATVEGRLDPACLEAGLRQVSPDLETNRAVDGSRLEFVLVPPATEPYGVKGFAALLVSRVKLQGFIVSDHMDKWPAALADLAGWYLEGKLRGRETVALGLRSAPAAFLGMLRGDNVGKQLVRL